MSECVCFREGISDQWNRIPGGRVWHRPFVQVIPQSSLGPRATVLGSALQPAFKITRLSFCYIVGLSEDPAPGSNRLVPGLTGGVGHGGGDTGLPAVTAGVSGTDAIGSRGAGTGTALATPRPVSTFLNSGHL